MLKEEQEIDYKKLFLDEKLSKLKTEATLLQLQFTKVQEQLQIVNSELTKYVSNEAEDIEDLQPE